MYAMYAHVYYSTRSSRVSYMCQPYSNMCKTNTHIKLKRIDATC
jgi:hypothetical protein